MEAGVVIGGIVIFISLCIGIWKFNAFIKSRYGGYSYLSIGKLAAISLAQIMTIFGVALYFDVNETSHANAYVVFATALFIILAVFIYNAKKTNIIFSFIGTIMEALTGLILMFVFIITLSLISGIRRRV